MLPLDTAVFRFQRPPQLLWFLVLVTLQCSLSLWSPLLSPPACPGLLFPEIHSQRAGWLVTSRQFFSLIQLIKLTFITSLMILTMHAISLFHAKPGMGLNFSISVATLSW